MGYSTDDSIVRVDFFKTSGKWYATEAIKWADGHYKDCCIHDALKISIRNNIGDRYQGMFAVCLEPYHENSHPLIVKEW